MIKNLKLLKYGYQFKSNMVFSVFFIILGVALITFIDTFKSPSMYMIFYCGFLIIIQTASTLMSSNIVKSSPKYRQFYFGIPRIINIAAFLSVITILCIIRFIQSGSMENFTQIMGNQLIIAGFEYFILLLYITFAYKFFIISLVLFCTSCVLSNGLLYFLFEAYSFNFWQGAVIAVLFFAFGMFLSEIAGRAIYKVQPSKLAQSVSFRKYM